MTNRERILAMLDGRAPDRIPWSPRLEIWYTANKWAGTLPPEYRDLDLPEIERRVAGARPARDITLWRERFDGVELRKREADGLTRVEYITPVGTVAEEFRETPQMRQQGILRLQTVHLLRRKEDYPVVEYLWERKRYVPAFEEYLEYERQVGDDGYPLVETFDCPFHFWMQQLVGYDQAYFHLQDWPETVERLLRLMTDRQREAVWPLMRQAPARLLLHGSHFSTQMTPPPLFEQYILPYYEELIPSLRKLNKVVALHGDADLSGLLPLVERAGFGLVECLATHPLVPLTLADARRAWGDRVIIWGGVPSTVLEPPYTDEQFERYMDDVVDTIRDARRFILGISDNAMPGSRIDRIRRVTERARELAVRHY